VGRAAAVAEARDAEHGWALLQAIPAEAVRDYQPCWALAAYLLARLQRRDEADAARERAIGLCEDPAMRTFLRQQGVPSALSSGTEDNAGASRLNQNGQNRHEHM